MVEGEDYKCWPSYSHLGCLLSVHSAEEAAAICNSQLQCQSFIITQQKTWTGEFGQIRWGPAMWCPCFLSHEWGCCCCPARTAMSLWVHIKTACLNLNIRWLLQWASKDPLSIHKKTWKKLHSLSALSFLCKFGTGLLGIIKQLLLSCRDSLTLVLG